MTIRATLGTTAAAKEFDRHPGTLRAWARDPNSPIKPLKIHGRLHWPVDEIRRVLGGTK